jgi:hypothetical protein
MSAEDKCPACGHVELAHSDTRPKCRRCFDFPFPWSIFLGGKRSEHWFGPKGTAAPRGYVRPGATLATVGVKTATGLACPRCGGTQFQPHRSTGLKWMTGAGSLLTPQTRVRCVTCGADYKR